MDKRVMFIIASILGIISVGGGIGYYFLNQQQTPAVSQVVIPTPTPVMPSATLKDYIDSSGFTFQHPDDTTVTTNETDTITYADLVLTNPLVSGSITARVQDTKLKSLDAWVKQNEATVAAGIVKEVQLGSLQAREITMEDKILTVAVDQKILFTIEVIPQTEKNYWENVYNTLLTSFNFVTPQQSTSTTDTSASSLDDVIFEGEEVVE